MSQTRAEITNTHDMRIYLKTEVAKLKDQLKDLDEALLVRRKMVGMASTDIYEARNVIAPRLKEAEKFRALFSYASSVTLTCKDALSLYDIIGEGF